MKRVQFTDRAVEYNSFTDVDKALRDPEAELSALQATTVAGFTLDSHSRETTARFMGISLRELRAKLGLLAVGLQGFQFIQDRLDYDILPNRTRRRQME